MCGVHAFTALVLILPLAHLSVSPETTQKNVLQIKEHWVVHDRRQTVPRLGLSTVLVNSTKVCLRVRLRMQPLLDNETLQIELTELATSRSQNIFVEKGHHGKDVVWWEEQSEDRRIFEVIHPFVSCRISGGRYSPVWILKVDCCKAQAGDILHVSVRELRRTLITASHIVNPLTAVNPRFSRAGYRDPVPVYNLTVDILAKRFVVNMEAGQKVKAKLCYEILPLSYVGHLPQQIDTDLNQTIILSFPDLVPCVCVQLYYIGVDTKRETSCPLKDKILPRGGDVLSSSSVVLFGSSVLEWKPLCPSAQPKPTVALCWQQMENHSHCITSQNSTLKDTDLKYNVSQVDKHAHMCVKFSLNDSHRVFCPFSSGFVSKWEVTIVRRSQRLDVQLFSSVPAVFAAQLCVEVGGACVVKGNIHSLLMEEGAKHRELNVPLPLSISGLCVQVWQAAPALLGRRTICPDYTHRRWGLIFAISLAFLITITTLGILTYNLIKRKTSVWRCAERKPVLLVCSSDDAAHVTAVCALASGLQEELCVDVRLAHWAHCSTQPSLARLGPAPWLYGQCQAVHRAGGMVLVAWSGDAQQVFFQWREEQVEEREHKWRGNVEREKTDEKNEGLAWIEDWKDKQREGVRGTSSIIAPVFIATLSRLWAGLHSERRGEGFGLVNFRGLGSSCHVPKDLRGIRRYCLPKDLSSLIHELDLKTCGPGGVKEAIGSSCCWPRLFSKAMSFWLSQRLAQRLEVYLPLADIRNHLTAKLMLNLSSKSDNEKNMQLKQKKTFLQDSPGKESMEYNEITKKELLGM